MPGITVCLLSFQWWDRSSTISAICEICHRGIWIWRLHVVENVDDACKLLLNGDSCSLGACCTATEN